MFVSDYFPIYHTHQLIPLSLGSGPVNAVPFATTASFGPITTTIPVFTTTIEPTVEPQIRKEFIETWIFDNVNKYESMF